jgi:hypothetical protein
MSTGFKVAFTFEVGDAEKHLVGFSYDQFWGGLGITVDGISALRTIRMFSVSMVKTYEFVIGIEEKHTVRFDKTRKLFFAGFRPQIVRAFVDGRQVAQDQSLGGTPGIFTTDPA